MKSENKKSAQDNSEHKLREAIELFYFAYRSFTAKPDLILKEIGLGRVHHRILYFIGRDPGLNINQLLKTLAVSKQALNEPLRKLTNLGLITVDISTKDRRVKQLSLSEEGRKLEQRLSQTQMQHLASVFKGVSASSLLAWEGIMAQLESPEDN